MTIPKFIIGPVKVAGGIYGLQELAGGTSQVVALTDAGWIATDIVTVGELMAAPPASKLEIAAVSIGPDAAQLMAAGAMQEIHQDRLREIYSKAVKPPEQMPKSSFYQIANPAPLSEGEVGNALADHMQQPASMESKMVVITGCSGETEKLKDYEAVAVAEYITNERCGRRLPYGPLGIAFYTLLLTGLMPEIGLNLTDLRYNSTMQINLWVGAVAWAVIAFFYARHRQRLWTDSYKEVRQNLIESYTLDTPNGSFKAT